MIQALFELRLKTVVTEGPCGAKSKSRFNSRTSAAPGNRGWSRGQAEANVNNHSQPTSSLFLPVAATLDNRPLHVDHSATTGERVGVALRKRVVGKRVANVQAPVAVDVSEPVRPIASASGIICIDMVPFHLGKRR